MGRIHSVQSLGACDGPGLRSVVFLQGCPLRCGWCHNPDTWDQGGGEQVSARALAAQLMRFAPYWAQGGVTASGGEPLLQSGFTAELFERLQDAGVHTALDTSGCLWDAQTDRLLRATDLVLLDVKLTTPQDYRAHTGCCLEAPLRFLGELQSRDIPVWIRHLILPGLTDSQESILRLLEMLEGFSCVQNLELLPFSRMCLEKYRALGIPFDWQDTPQPPREQIERLYQIVRRHSRHKEAPR